MKKLLVSLSVIFTFSLIVCALLAGKIYYKDIKTYTDYDKQMLEIKSLNNIYIDSYIPVDIYPTTEAPYVEFNQTFVDLTGIAPQYELKIEHKADSTYINLNQIKELILYLGIKQNDARLTIYLPQQAINELNIQNYVYDYNRDSDCTVNLEGMNIKDLQAHLNHGTISLEGEYEKVNLYMNSGTLEMVSEGNSSLYIEGNVRQHLSGEFEKIITKSSHSSISIDSTKATNVQLATHGANINLQGKYSNISIIGDHNSVDINSDSPGNLVTEGSQNQMMIRGAFNKATLVERNSNISLQTDLIPDRIQLGGCKENTSVTLTLPSNIGGFTVKYVNSDAYNSSNDRETYESYILEEKIINSEFGLEQRLSESKNLIYTYGTGKVPIILNQNEKVMLDIIDGGYSSKS